MSIRDAVRRRWYMPHLSVVRRLLRFEWGLPPFDDVYAHTQPVPAVADVSLIIRRSIS